MGETHETPGDPAAAPARPQRRDDAGAFVLVIDSIEDFVTFMGLLLERQINPLIVADFAAAKSQRRAAVTTSGFYLAFSSLHDLIAFIGIVRGQILDVSALAEVSTHLARARAVFAASVDRAGGTPASPAAGPPFTLPPRPLPVHVITGPIQPFSTGELSTMPDDPQAIIDGVVAEASADATVMGSASSVIDGFDALVAAAVAKALDGGATAAQLAPFAEVRTILQTSRETLAASIAARTPAKSEVPAALKHLNSK